jgi:hypothetical protein
MHLTPAPGATGENARVDLELRADGTLYSHGQFVGQLSGQRVLDADGHEILTVSPDGGVSVNGRPLQIRLSDAGEIVRSNGATMRFADDGTPLVAAPGQPAQQGPLRLLGFRPEARRTAGLLALLVATVALPSGR